MHAQASKRISLFTFLVRKEQGGSHLSTRNRFHIPIQVLLSSYLDRLSPIIASYIPIQVGNAWHLTGV